MALLDDGNKYFNNFKYDEWDNEEDFERVKQMILFILKEQKVSLSQSRYLLCSVLADIERKNPVNI